MVVKLIGRINDLLLDGNLADAFFYFLSAHENDEDDIKWWWFKSSIFLCSFLYLIECVFAALQLDWKFYWSQTILILSTSNQCLHSLSSQIKRNILTKSIETATKLIESVKICVPWIEKREWNVIDLHKKKIKCNWSNFFYHRIHSSSHTAENMRA